MRPKIDPIAPGTYDVENGAFKPDERKFLLRERKNVKGKTPYYLTTESFDYVSSLWPCNNGSRYRFDYQTPEGKELIAYVMFGDGTVTIEEGGESKRSRSRRSSSAPWN